MKINQTKISELIPYVNNARTHSDEQVSQIASSIKEFGFCNPVLTDGDNGIIAGHGRVMAAKKLGIDTVPVIELSHLSDIQKKAYILADNKLAENAGWDMDLVNIELEALNIDDFGIDLTGFEFEPENESGGLTDEDEVPEVPEEPVTKLGDLWTLGEHRLLCGDSTEIEQVERLMDGKKADMVFTDPPYELDTKGGGILKSANSMKQIRENKVDSFNPECLTLYAKTNIFCHNKPLIKKYIELSEQNKVSFDLCFYKKTNTAPNYGGHMMTDTEYIAIVGRQSPNKGLDKEYYSKCFIGKKDIDNALSYSKPVALCEKFIKLYSKKNVLDTFLGSGSTLIACEKTNRKCYGIELDPHYCDVIIKRWEDYTGNKAELLTNKSDKNGNYN